MKILIADIIAHASRVFEVTVADIKGKGRKKHLVRPRQAVMHLARDLTGKSYPEIGAALGGRDHSTVIHGRETCLMHMQRDPDYAAKVRLVRNLSRRGAMFKAREWQPGAPDKPKPLVALEPPQWIVTAPRKRKPRPEPEYAWWDASDDELLTEAVRRHRDKGLDFLEVWQ